MRKSPYIKEMVSIRNAIKILKDSDVKISTKEDSLRTIQKECIDLLDLSFNESDIREIEADGAKSLERDYADGVIECLILFADLLEIGIGKFLRSNKFKYILLKENFDEDWNTLEEYVDERIDKPMFVTPDYTERVEEKLKYLINQIYRKEPKEYFLYFVSKIIEEFVEWSDDYISLQNIKNTLLGFDYTEEDIDTLFYFTEVCEINIP